jgi:hypothetical protein
MYFQLNKWLPMRISECHSYYVAVLLATDIQSGVWRRWWFRPPTCAGWNLLPNTSNFLYKELREDCTFIVVLCILLDL